MNSKKNKKKSRGGRPKIDESLKRKIFPLMLNSAEKKELKEQQIRFEFDSLNEYIRYLIFTNSKNITNLNPKESLKELNNVGYHLKKIGNNINQIAKYANEFRQVGKYDEDILKAFTEIMQSYNEQNLETNKLMKKAFKNF